MYGHELDDPFIIDENQWLEDLTKWPELEFGDVYTYLINSNWSLYKGKTEGVQIRCVQLLLQWICMYCLPPCYRRMEHSKSQSKP